MKSDGTIERESAYLNQIRATRARNEADDLRQENARLAGLLKLADTENAQLRERLQLAESRLSLAESGAAEGEALAAYIIGDEWPVSVAGGMAALAEARR